MVVDGLLGTVLVVVMGVGLPCSLWSRRRGAGRRHRSSGRALVGLVFIVLSWCWSACSLWSLCTRDWSSRMDLGPCVLFRGLCGLGLLDAVLIVVLGVDRAGVFDTVPRGRGLLDAVLVIDMGGVPISA